MLRATWALAIFFGLVCLGCARVQRTVSINSDPEGALLTMNDQEVGRTPVTRDFIWYGWYDVTLRLEGYKTLKTRAKVIAPAWQWPPFDLLAEFSPARLKDKHRILFKLEPEEEPPSNDDMLGRAEQMRLQLESSTNTKNPSTRPVTQPATTQWTTGPATTQTTEPSTTQSSTEPSTTQSTTGPTTGPTTAPTPAPTTQPTSRPSFLLAPSSPPGEGWGEGAFGLKRVENLELRTVLPLSRYAGRGWVRVREIDTVFRRHIDRANPHPNLLPEYREKEWVIDADTVSQARDK